MMGAEIDFSFRGRHISGRGEGRHSYYCDWTQPDRNLPPFKGNIPVYLCTVEGKRGDWYVHLKLTSPRESLGPFKTRWEAANAYLGHYLKGLTEEIPKPPPSFDWPTPRRDPRTLTEEQAVAVYDVLVNRCGAHSSRHDRRDFIHAMMKAEPVREYRFGGWLGHGGKFWNDPGCFRVTAYGEDETPMVAWRLAQARWDLFKLWMSWFWDGFYEIRTFSRLFGMQNQYFSRYLYPAEAAAEHTTQLCEDLRIEWRDGRGYHFVYIHKDDAEELVRRVSEHRSGFGYEPVTWEAPSWSKLDR